MTILKNPDSVFDIEKPDTIASSMAVISQTFIDACSVTEHKPTKVSLCDMGLYLRKTQALVNKILIEVLQKASCKIQNRQTVLTTFV